MNYLIIEVEGLSMGPFLVSNEMVLVDLNAPLEQFENGSLYFDQKIVHRAIYKNILKGDRLIYNDQLTTEKKFRVLGRVINKNPLIFSNYDSIVLITISKLIALLSRQNYYQNRFRKFFVFLIIIFSRIHRLLEFFFTTRKSK